CERVNSYLDKWHHRFYLYGDQPFLQMPAIAAAAVKSFGTVLPDVATGNTTVLTQSQFEKSLDDADKAILLLTQMALALSGKKVDNSVVLTAGYQGKSNDKGKPSSGKPGPAVAHMGMLHNFCLSDSVVQSVWLNVFTHAEIATLTIYPQGLGIAPWEQMPSGEACEIAEIFKQTLMGRLLPLCRFCLLNEGGLHYSEGILHASHKEGVYDPSIAVDHSGKEAKVAWCNPERRPWRELTGLLSFLAEQGGRLDCIQLRLATPKAMQHGKPFAIWSGGLRVSSNAGEQYASGADDVVESVAWLTPSELGDRWFSQLQAEMDELDKVSRTLYGCVMGYFKQQLVDGKDVAAQASNQFWQLCERQSQALLEDCDDISDRYSLRRQFATYANQVFNHYCPAHTARQLDAWAQAKPHFAAYLKQEQA
ncbi:MAG: type I-E CRISPR-associated protein Cse1/CasA, partial [Plesiomonas sp.]